MLETVTVSFTCSWLVAEPRSIDRPGRRRSRKRAGQLPPPGMEMGRRGLFLAGGET